MITINRRFWLKGLGIGLFVAIVVTAIATIWEWRENPAGIYRDADGTRWNFVLDTAISWLVPTFFYATIIALSASLCWSAVTEIYKEKKNRGAGNSRNDGIGTD